MNFAELVRVRGTEPETRNRTFIMYRDADENIRHVSYSEFYEQCILYAKLLSALRAQRKTDRQRYHVGAYMQNVPEFLYLLGGCAFAGATLVGINNAQIGEKLACDINTMDVDLLFVDSAVHRTGRPFIKEVLDSQAKYGFHSLEARHIFLLPSDQRPDGISDLAAKLDECSKTSAAFEPSQLDPDATGIIIFTSGTTGVPKGIEVPWRKLVDVAITSTNVLKYTRDDVGYVCMPLNHSNALYLNVMPALWNGAKIALRRRFSATTFVKDLTDFQITVWNCVGDPVQYVLNVVGDRDYSHLPLRVVISTGTPPDNREKFSRIFGLEQFVEVYGSTEVGAITAITPDSPRYSVGRVLKDIKIVAEDDPNRECELAVMEGGRIKNFDRAVGEIVVGQASLGASKFVGYYKLPEVSARSVDANNYYHMGDLGAITQDAEGRKYLIFLGRTGDWIRSKGENWAAVDVENILLRSTGVVLAAIVGVPQAEGREDDPMYILEVPDPASFDAQRFYEWCVEQLPRYALPRFIRIVASMPKTDTMKVQKKSLKSEFYQRTPEHDIGTGDLLYEVVGGQVKRFSAADYRRELARFTDPVARDRLVVFSGNPALFPQED